MSRFADRLIAWQGEHGRHDLPWQLADAYRVWLSEIMLQQTQVATVIDYYQRFLQRFPDIASLAAAPLDDVLALWSGLGYYTRARNLHKAARVVMGEFGGVFPRAPNEIETLPGVGRSTAAAIAAFSFDTRAAILDGNVKRVLARWAGVDGFPGTKAVEGRLWALADSLLPESGSDMPAYTQAQMDLGASVCTPKKPACLACPVSSDCVARLTGRQAELPTPKPKKAVPERRTVMLLIRDDDGRLLLQKRPPSGIWGGLWCLPETGSTLDAERYCAEQLQLKVELEPALPDFSHVFTHFKLAITPQPATLIGAHALADDAALRWFSRTDALQAGIPTPLRRLLNA